MTRLKPLHVYFVAALMIPAAVMFATDQACAELLRGSPLLRDSHDQQALDLAREQQRHRVASKPATPGEYFHLRARYLEERNKQLALQARQLRNVQTRERRHGAHSTLTHRPTDRIRYQQQKTAQRLGFKRLRRP